MGGLFAGLWIGLILLVWVAPYLSRIADALERLADASDDDKKGGG